MSTVAATALIPVDVVLNFDGYVLREFTLRVADSLYGQPCPSCRAPLGADGRPVARMAISICADAPNPRGWSLFGSVVMHAACAHGASDG